MNHTGSRQVALSEVRRVIRESGLSGRSICLHSSFRSFGAVTGGPDTIIDAFLDEDCTILVPTFSWDAYATAPGWPRPDRNGTDYDAWLRSVVADDSERRFSPESNEIDLASMGVVAGTLLRRPRRARGDHPLCSFTALGPQAVQLVAGQAADAVFSPLERVAERRGAFVLAGVGLNRLTAVHLAEQMSGRSMFVRWGTSVDWRRGCARRRLLGWLRRSGARAEGLRAAWPGWPESLAGFRRPVADRARNGGDLGRSGGHGVLG